MGWVAKSWSRVGAGAAKISDIADEVFGVRKINFEGRIGLALKKKWVPVTDTHFRIMKLELGARFVRVRTFFCVVMTVGFLELHGIWLLYGVRCLRRLF